MNPSTSRQKYTPKYLNGNPIWKFFHIDNPQCCYAKCFECGKDFCRGFASKNTTNLRTHLKQKHPNLHQQLLELCEEERNLPPPPVVEFEFDDVVDTVSEYDENDDDDEGDDFVDASEDYVDESVNEKLNESVDDISNAVVIYKPPTSHFDDDESSAFYESFTSPPLNSNSYGQQHSHHQQNATNSPKPDISMSEEELRKRLLIAQIEREEAQANREISASGYFQACTAAIHSRFPNQ